jgi:hypothetical protein
MQRKKNGENQEIEGDKNGFLMAEGNEIRRG